MVCFVHWNVPSFLPTNFAISDHLSDMSIYLVEGEPFRDFVVSVMSSPVADEGVDKLNHLVGVFSRYDWSAVVSYHVEV